MEGKIGFPESLNKRLSLFKTNKNHIDKLISLLEKKITPSVARNKVFFRENKNNIYIISGGFSDYIVPVVKEFGIDPTHVLANSFTFGKVGQVTGIDTKNPLSTHNGGGKPEAVKNLKLTGKVYVVGDGYTDYQIKEKGFAKKFFAFIENINRPGVLQKADDVVFNFDELLYLFNIPRSVSYPRNKIKVLILGSIHKTAIEIFSREGYSIETLSKQLPKQILLEKIKDATIFIPDSTTQITKEILSEAKKLLVIGRFGLGTASLDLEAATELGIAVFNAPFSNIRSVAEMVIGEAVMLSRNVFDQSKSLHNGNWKRSIDNSHEVRGKTLGIIGYDAVGTQVSILAEDLGMNVCFYDREEKLPQGNVKRLETLEELFQTADIISLHITGRKEIKDLINEQAFSLMKQGVFIINLSRGYVIDEKLLAKNIVSGKVKGAAIDVFPKEGDSKGKFKSLLQNLPNVILTPHIGGSTQEALKDGGEFVSYHIIQFINTGGSKLSVNFPNLTLPDHPNAHRIIHIHKNMPGILAKINNIMAKNNINIEGQYLKTNEQVGYVITDINANHKDDVIGELKKIPGTIKVRVLY